MRPVHLASEAACLGMGRFASHPAITLGALSAFTQCGRHSVQSRFVQKQQNSLLTVLMAVKVKGEQPAATGALVLSFHGEGRGRRAWKPRTAGGAQPAIMDLNPAITAFPQNGASDLITLKAPPTLFLGAKLWGGHSFPSSHDMTDMELTGVSQGY